MLWILIIGIVMAVGAAIAWCFEAMIYVNAVRSVPKAKGFFGELRRSLQVISKTNKLLPLALDIVCTIWLTGAFGFTGLIGGVLGLTISNVISVFILYVSKQKPKEVSNAQTKDS